jgi:predicted transcriptional regulator
MDLQLPERQTAGLVSLSTRTGRSTGELVAEAVDRLLAQESWFDAQVQLGIDQIARGEFLEEEEMDARVARMIRA